MFLPKNTAAVGHGRGKIPTELVGVRKPKHDELVARLCRMLLSAPEEEVAATDKFDILLLAVLKAIQLTGDVNRLQWILEQIMPSDQRKAGDIEEFKVEYLRYMDRKKLVALVKEGQEEKKNEDV
jgi:hypothetical protein